MKLIKKFNPWTRTFQYINIETSTSGLDVYIQPTEPTLPVTKTMALWEDTTSGRKLMIYRDSIGTQNLVELS